MFAMNRDVMNLGKTTPNINNYLAIVALEKLGVSNPTEQQIKDMEVFVKLIVTLSQTNKILMQRWQKREDFISDILHLHRDFF